MIGTDELARRLEAAEAIDAAECAEAACAVDPDVGPAVEGVAGGILTFCGPVSPLTHALALGMHGPISEAELDHVEDFFRSRGAPVVVDVCPHADQSLRELLSARGYHISEMNNVLVRMLRPDEPLPEAAISVNRAEDADLYARTIGTGFFGREEITDEEFRIGQILFRMRSGIPMLAFVDGKAAGGCGLSVRNGVASLFGDATLTHLRRGGVHAAMIGTRLRSSVGSGCDLATAGTQPGSGSQRNYQRLGFEVAYTRVTMVSA